MDPLNYDELIREQIQPDLVDNIVVPKLEKLMAYFTKNTNVKSGITITDQQALTETAAGGAFTRGDADPDSLSATWAEAAWTKVYYHEAADVRGETISETSGDGAVIQNIIEDMSKRATRQLMDTHVYGGCMTQIKADVDSNNTYGSSSALTRGTEIQSYEENTVANWTLAYHRAMSSALELKEETDWSQYISLFNPSVWKIAWPLMDALTSKYRMNPTSGETTAAGYMDVSTFDGIPVAPMYGMTTGDNLLLNRNDVQVQNHLPLELTLRTPKELGAFQYKVIARIGINAWVRRPSRNGKLTLKD